MPMVPAVAGPRSEMMSPKRLRGDDHVEAVRIEHHLDGEAVDVVLVGA